MYKLLTHKNIDEVCDDYINFAKRINQVIDKDILKQELSCLIRKIKYQSFQDKFLFKFLTNRITINGLELSKFNIYIGLSISLGKNPYIEVKAIRPNRCLIKRNLTHPHIEDNYICLGEYSSPIYQNILNGRIDDAIYMINEVIKNYDEKASYIDIKNWYGYKCDNCCSVQLQHTSTCKCGEKFCLSCSKLCNLCGYKHHISCSSIQCFKCNSINCIYKTIKYINNLYCLNCCKYCYECGTETLNGKYCIKCDNRICQNCKIEYKLNISNDKNFCTDCKFINCKNCYTRIRNSYSVNGFCLNCSFYPTCQIPQTLIPYDDVPF